MEDFKLSRREMPPPASRLFARAHAEGSNKIEIGFYRQKVDEYVNKQDYKSACFWADKLVVMNHGALRDVHKLVEVLCLCGKYQRALNVLEQYKCEKINLHFRWLTARCLYLSKEFQKALNVLNAEDMPQAGRSTSNWQPKDGFHTIQSQVYLLKGKIYLALLIPSLAAKNLTDALKANVYCIEALELLTQNELLKAFEESQLLKSLTPEMCPNNDFELVENLWESHLKKSTAFKKVEQCDSDSDDSSPTLADSLDVLATEAEQYFYNCDFKSSYDVCSKILKKDPYHGAGLKVFIGCLFEMKKTAELYKLSHRLMRVLPESTVAWYAMGAYSYVIDKHDPCREYLNKAVTIDPFYGPAWILLGHSFAKHHGSEKATEMYCKASRFMPGCHVTMYHVGVVYSRALQSELALKFFEPALRMTGIAMDPFILHEMGVVKFNEKKYEEAIGILIKSVELVEKVNPKANLFKVEPFFNNLGHCWRKLRQYDRAYKCHKKALQLCPHMSTSHTAIGFLHALTGRSDLAVESFLRAVALKAKDPFTKKMLDLFMDIHTLQYKAVNDDDEIEPEDSSSLDDLFKSTSDLMKKEKKWWSRKHIKALGAGSSK